LGRDAAATREAWLEIWASGEQPFATSALSIALDDLRGRQAGRSIAELYGGRLRDRVRAYAAHQGYVEGVDPERSWRDDVTAALDAGFTAFKFRVGRYPMAREGKLLGALRQESGAAFTFVSDRGGAETAWSAIDM